MSISYDQAMQAAQGMLGGSSGLTQAQIAHMQHQIMMNAAQMSAYRPKPSARQLAVADHAKNALLSLYSSDKSLIWTDAETVDKAWEVAELMVAAAEKRGITF